MSKLLQDQQSVTALLSLTVKAWRHDFSQVKMVLLSFQKLYKCSPPFLEFWKVAVVQKVRQKSCVVLENEKGIANSTFLFEKYCRKKRGKKWHGTRGQEKGGKNGERERERGMGLDSLSFSGKMQAYFSHNFHHAFPNILTGS